jgi:hypothetical protein
MVFAAAFCLLALAAARLHRRSLSPV